jgi:hypothetical protein
VTIEANRRVSEMTLAGVATVLRKRR